MRPIVWQMGGWMLAAFIPFGCGGSTFQSAVKGSAGASTPPGVDDADNLCPDEVSVSVVLPISTPGGLRWMLHDKEAAKQDVLFPVDSEEAVRPLTEGEVEEHGAAASGSDVWVYLEDEVPPCAMRTETSWAVHHGDGVLRTHLFLELVGDCALSEDHASYVALRDVEEARGCRLHELPLMASDRGGEETPIPGLIKPVLPDLHCEGEGCFRWVLYGARVDSGEGIYEMGAVWLHPPEGDDPLCSASFDGFRGVFHQAKNGLLHEIDDVEGVRALLYDRRGLRAVVMDSRGAIGLLLPSTEGSFQPGSRQRYMSWNEGNQTAIDAIQPSCPAGPDWEPD